MPKIVVPFVRSSSEFEDCCTNWYACGNCDNPVDYRDKYCKHCGKELMWEDTSPKLLSVVDLFSYDLSKNIWVEFMFNGNSYCYLTKLISYDPIEAEFEFEEDSFRSNSFARQYYNKKSESGWRCWSHRPDKLLLDSTPWRD